MTLREAAIFLAALVPSVILHEVSHGVVALWFGDDTAKKAGRLTLNPIKHVDPFGTIILPAILIFVSGRPFGYAKPVPVNPRQLRSPRNHGLLVSLAGPLVNIVLAAIALGAFRLAFQAGATSFRTGDGLVIPTGTSTPTLILEVLEVLGLVNVVLAVFNLIPVPPLDGSAVIERFIPAQFWAGYLRLRQYSMPVLFLVVFLRPQWLSGLFNPAVELWWRLAGLT